MRETVTISLPSKMRRDLDREAKKSSANRSKIMQEALRRYLIDQELDRLRAIAVPIAQSQGIFTDEDVFERFK